MAFPKYQMVFNNLTFNLVHQRLLCDEHESYFLKKLAYFFIFLNLKSSFRT